MLNLSRTKVRNLIWAELEAEQAVKHRWLQEHPNGDTIVSQMVSDTLELVISAHEERSATQPSFWNSMNEDEIVSTAVGMILDSPDLWGSIEEEFPREAPSTHLDVMTELMAEVPMSGRLDRTGPFLHRKD